MAVAAVLVGSGLLVGLWMLVRRRRGWRTDPAAAERALRAQAERDGVQRRMTDLHPDFVRDWMRPR